MIFDLKIYYLNLKNYNWVWKLTFCFKIFLFEYESWYFNFILKKLFDLKVEIWIPNYYFGYSKLIFQFRKLLIEF